MRELSEFDHSNFACMYFTVITIVIALSFEVFRYFEIRVESWIPNVFEGGPQRERVALSVTTWSTICATPVSPKRPVAPSPARTAPFVTFSRGRPPRRTP